MNKEEIIAAFVMENIFEPHKPQNVKKHSRNGIEFLRFRTVLQSLGVQNRNRRTYTVPAITKAILADHVQELLNKKNLLGEAGHPLSDDPKRIVTIDPKYCSHFITSLEVIGDLVYGDIETRAGSIFGQELLADVVQGLEPAFSLRALASLVKKGDGSSLANGRVHMVTYDRVILPSHKEAYRDKSVGITAVNKGLDSNFVTEGGIIVPLTESAVKDFIAMESANVKLVSNFCEVAMESMELSQDLKTVILRENGGMYQVKLEEKIRHEVRDFFIGL